MGRDTCMILPEAAATGTGVEVLHPTPYGPVTERAGALIRTAGTDARALIYAAKALGSRRILAADVGQAVSPLLEPGDLFVPGDIVDRTRLRQATFFPGKGYGFVRFHPAFCPDLTQTLYGIACATRPRTFRRATYVGVEGPREATPAELRMYRQWGADLVGSGLVPEAFLARELELCYGALVGVGVTDFFHILESAAELERGEIPCACRESMAGPRAQGLIGEDWRTWLST